MDDMDDIFNMELTPDIQQFLYIYYNLNKEGRHKLLELLQTSLEDDEQNEKIQENHR